MSLTGHGVSNGIVNLDSISWFQCTNDIFGSVDFHRSVLFSHSSWSITSTSGKFDLIS